MRTISTAIALVLALAGVALAGECQTTCTADARICSQGAVSEFKSCRAEARATVTGRERRDAIHSCRDAYRTAQKACIGDLRACLHACPVTPADTCKRDCIATGFACSRTAIADGRTCVQACEPGRSKFRCVADCFKQVAGAVRECRRTVGSCIQACNSPAAAFVD